MWSQPDTHYGSLGFDGEDPLVSDPEVDQERARAALRLYAKEERSVPSPDEYDHWRWVAYRRGRLPRAGRIMRAFDGTWVAALREAGFVIKALPNPGRATVAEALVLCAMAHRVTPTRLDLERFLRANKLTLIDSLWTGFWPAMETTPGMGPLDRRPSERPDFNVPVLAGPGLRRKRGKADRTRCVDALEAFVEQLRREEPDARPTSRRYQRFVAAGEGGPSLSTMHRFGGFAKLRAEALENLEIELSLSTGPGSCRE